MRIRGFDETKYIERDGFTPTPEFWENTLLGKMIPFEPSSYVRVGSGGSIQNVSQQWGPGLVGLYTKHVKYPENNNSTAGQPLQLVYSSPSFSNNKSIIFGVFIYKVNHDYVPKPLGNPYSPQEQKPSVNNQTSNTTPTNAPKADMTPSSQLATIETSQGTIKIEFFPKAAPNHVENFIKLANQRFYDGTLFHRIIPGFMIQGGDPNTKGDNSDRNTWGQGGPEHNVNAEFNDIPHTRGIVSMARATDPNSAGSQFFVVQKDSTFLDGKYTVFGRVLEGMDVVDKIAGMSTYTSGEFIDQPIDPEQVRVLSIKIETR